MPQRVEHQHLQPFQQRQAPLWDAVHVSAVGDAVDAKPEHAELGVDEYFRVLTKDARDQAALAGVDLQTEIQQGHEVELIVNYAKEYPWVWGLEVLPVYDAIARVKSHAHWQTDVIAGWASRRTRLTTNRLWRKLAPPGDVLGLCAPCSR